MSDPLSRRAGRWWGRWWRDNGAQVRRRSLPARRGLAVAMSYLWLVGYLWVGTMLAVGLQALTRVEGPYTLLVGAGGGAALGWWQARHRLAAVDDPARPPLRGFGLALLGWLAAIALALLLDA